MEVISHPKSVKVLAYYLFFFCSAPIGTTGFSWVEKICKSVGRAQQTVTFPTCSLFSLLTILPVFVSPPFLLFGSPRDGAQQIVSDLFFSPVAPSGPLLPLSLSVADSLSVAEVCFPHALPYLCRR